MKRIASSVALALTLIGCTPPIVQMNSQFNPADYEKYDKPGTCTMTGQAFLRTVGGDVKFGAGCRVDLYPLTPYQAERLRMKTMNGVNLEPLDQRVVPYVRSTWADGTGNFEFDHLPAGKYAAYCEIRWQVPNGYIMSWTGGTAFGVIEVAPGETKKVVVTR